MFWVMLIPLCKDEPFTPLILRATVPVCSKLTSSISPFTDPHIEVFTLTSSLSSLSSLSSSFSSFSSECSFLITFVSRSFSAFSGDLSV